jgi:nucleotide-binding universal stress UspA family protein
MFKRVLLCHDGSAAGRLALKRGAELAIDLRAHVDVLLITSAAAAQAAITAASVGQACVTGGDEEFRRSLEESVARLRARGVEANGHLASGKTIEVIAEYARKLGTDLIVVGHYPQPTGGRWWSGGDRNSLAECVSCCVLIARGD